MGASWVRRFLAPTLGGGALFAILVGGGLLYASFGGGSRDDLVTQMLINAIIVVGIQVYVGTTGVLSFGHIGFGAVAGYTFAAFAISTDRKAVTVSDMPFGLSEVSWSPAAAMLMAVLVALAVAVVVGLGLTRSGAQSGAVAATVITLALLFMVHEVAVNWDDLTGGDRAGLSFAIGTTLGGRWPIFVALLGTLISARLFATSNTGRQARAAREDDLAARAMGINPAGPQMTALLLSVAMVAIGSSLRVYDLGSITPKFFFFDFTLVTLTMLIVGGRNSVSGALVGVVIITAGNELTRYLAGPDVDVADFVFRPGLTDIFLGGSMLGFMILRPTGLLDDWELDEWVLRRLRRRTAEQSAPSEEAAPVVTSPSRLDVTDVTVDFGGFRALFDARLHTTSAEVAGIIGPNGAGKTTLLNVVTGLVSPSSGRFSIDGVELAGAPAHRIARAGLVRTFQNLRLFGALTVRENVEIAALVAARHRRDRPTVRVDGLLVGAGLWDHRNRRARELDYGNARRLELARAAAAAPAFLLLDEPTSGMSDEESLAMIEQVRRTASVVGAGVVVIDHDLGFITGICDRISCFDQGAVIAEGTPEQIQADPGVQAAYLGTATPA